MYVHYFSPWYTKTFKLIKVSMTMQPQLQDTYIKREVLVVTSLQFTSKPQDGVLPFFSSKQQCPVLLVVYLRLCITIGKSVLNKNTKQKKFLDISCLQFHVILGRSVCCKCYDKLIQSCLLAHHEQRKQKGDGALIRVQPYWFLLLFLLSSFNVVQTPISHLKMICVKYERHRYIE